MPLEIPQIKQEAGSLSTKGLDIYSNVIVLLPARDAGQVSITEPVSHLR